MFKLQDISVCHYLVLNAYVVMLLYGIRAQDYTSRPDNTLFAKVGEPVTFDCTLESSEGETATLVWREVINDEPMTQPVAVNGMIQPHYLGVFEMEGENHLKLLAASFDKAHMYRCEDEMLNTQLDAQLIVLNSNPVCTGPSSNIILEGGTLTYQCQIEFAGVWSPQMSWEGSKQGAIQGDDSGSTESVKISSISVVAAVDGNSEIFSCFTNFGNLDPAPGANEATNVISYNYSQTMPVIQVHYTPRNTEIVDRNGSKVGADIYPGEELSCMSQSNPGVSEYIWMLTKENGTAEEVGSTESVTVTENWLGDVTLRCTVRNQMGENGNVTGEDSVEESFNMYNKNESTISTTDDTRWIESIESKGVSLALMILTVLTCCLIVALVLSRRKISKLTGAKQKVIPELKKEGAKESPDSGIKTKQDWPKNRIGNCTAEISDKLTTIEVYPERRKEGVQELPNLGQKSRQNQIKYNMQNCKAEVSKKLETNDYSLELTKHGVKESPHSGMKANRKPKMKMQQCKVPKSGKYQAIDFKAKQCLDDSTTKKGETKHYDNINGPIQHKIQQGGETISEEKDCGNGDVQGTETAGLYTGLYDNLKEPEQNDFYDALNS